jgi:hypothetical protein
LVSPNTDKPPLVLQPSVNRVITLIGVALVVVGLVVSFVPLFNGPSEVLTSSRSAAAFNATSQTFLSSDWTIGVSWTSNQEVSILVIVCHSINASASSLRGVCPGVSLTVINGTSGSGTFSVPAHGVILVGIVSMPTNGVRVNVQLKPTLTLIGAILVFGGVGVTAVGLLPRRKARAPPASGTPPTSPPASPPEGPS